MKYSYDFMEHNSNYQTFGYTDLHNHLYGCLSAESLYRIGKNNPNPRWNVFTDSHKCEFPKSMNSFDFFRTYDTIEKFSELYYFNQIGTFQDFQAKFNLIIAMVEFSLREMEQVAYEVAIQHSKIGVRYAEYRIMFSKDEERDIFNERIIAVCEGLKRAEIVQSITMNPIQARAVYSLHRSINYLEHYEWLKELMNKNLIVQKYIVGLDFCYVEEGYPPKDKKEFFSIVLKDNKSQHLTALSILYHVGESFTDKTPFSASRWILESSWNGAHRLGHCIALGIGPEVFLNQIRTEPIQERMDQLRLELEFYDSIRNFGEYYSKVELEKKSKELSLLEEKKQIFGVVEIKFNERDIEFLRTFQNFCMKSISSLSTVIESCPSSNYYIGMIQSPHDHPLPRFISQGLKVTISTDDPGIFNTDIIQEFRKAKEMGIRKEDLENIRIQSFQYTSEILSGRLQIN